MSFQADISQGFAVEIGNTPLLSACAALIVLDGGGGGSTGPTGPTGVGPTGPSGVGSTGPSGLSITGPTGPAGGGGGTGASSLQSAYEGGNQIVVANNKPVSIRMTGSTAITNVANCGMVVDSSLSSANVGIFGISSGGPVLATTEEIVAERMVSFPASNQIDYGMMLPNMTPNVTLALVKNAPVSSDAALYSVSSYTGTIATVTSFSGGPAPAFSSPSGAASLVVISAYMGSTTAPYAALGTLATPSNSALFSGTNVGSTLSSMQHLFQLSGTCTYGHRVYNSNSGIITAALASFEDTNSSSTTPLQYLNNAGTGEDIRFTPRSVDAVTSNNSSLWYNSIMNRLRFRDSSSTTRSLAYSDIASFDAYVPDDYATVGDAVTAGKVCICVLSTVVESGTVNVPTSTTVYLCRNANLFSYSSPAFLNTSGTNISFTINGTNSTNVHWNPSSTGAFYNSAGVDASTLYMSNINFVNGSSTSDAHLSNAAINMKQCRVTAPNLNNCGITLASSSPHSLTDVVFTGGGASCQRILNTLSNAITANMNGLTFTGTYGANMAVINRTNASDIFLQTASITTFYIGIPGGIGGNCNVNNFQSNNGTITVSIEGVFNTVSNISNLDTVILPAIGGGNSIVSNITNITTLQVDSAINHFSNGQDINNLNVAENYNRFYSFSDSVTVTDSRVHNIYDGFNGSALNLTNVFNVDTYVNNCDFGSITIAGARVHIDNTTISGTLSLGAAASQTQVANTRIGALVTTVGANEARFSNCVIEDTGTTIVTPERCTFTGCRFGTSGGVGTLAFTGGNGIAIGNSATVIGAIASAGNLAV